MISKQMIERIIREEVRNFLIGNTGNSNRKRKPVQIGYVNLAADPSPKGLTPARKDTFVSKIADMKSGTMQKFEIPTKGDRKLFIKRVQAKIHYCRKRTGYTLSSHTDDGYVYVERN